MIVDLSLSEDQQMIEDSLRGFLLGRLPIERLRNAANHAGGGEHAVWGELAELGLFGLGLPEAQGGLGYGMAEEALVARAFGANLASPSLVAQLLAPHFATDSSVRAALVQGSQRAAFARIGGHAVDADRADHLLVLSGSKTGLISAASAPSGDAVAAMDETVSLRPFAAEPVLSADDTRIVLMLAAYLTGIAQTATSMAVEYAKTREQFGQPIGGFQAIKHMCADMAVRAAAAESQVFYAAITAGEAECPAGEVAAAWMLAKDAVMANTKANIQIHGGMGFTAECDAHLLLKRVHLVAALGPTAAELRSRILAMA